MRRETLGRRRVARTSAALLGGLLALACGGFGSEPPPPPAPLSDTRTHRHTEGFHLEVPVDAEVSEVPGGVTVRPEGWRTQRSPYRLEVRQLSDAGEDAGAELAEELLHEGRRVRFQRATEEGGSGGPLHVVEGVVFLHEGDGVFHLELSEQAEASRAPSEAVFWTVAQTLGR